MKHTHKSVTLTLWLTRCIAVLVVALALGMPAVMRELADVLVLPESRRGLVLTAFYLCLVGIAPALWNIDRLLCAIGSGQVFVEANVRRLLRIRLCCALVSLICAVTGFICFPVWFLAVIMGFLWFLIRVVADVIQAAVYLREENDLTI